MKENSQEREALILDDRRVVYTSCENLLLANVSLESLRSISHRPVDTVSLHSELGEGVREGSAVPGATKALCQPCWTVPSSTNDVLGRKERKRTERWKEKEAANVVCSKVPRNEQVQVEGPDAG